MEKSWGGVTRLVSETETARTLTNGAWTKTQSLTLTPGTWEVFGAARIKGGASNSGAYAYICIGPDSGFQKGRSTFPIDIGVNNYASLNASTVIVTTVNLTVNLYILPSVTSQSQGEYLNAIKND